VIVFSSLVGAPGRPTVEIVQPVVTLVPLNPVVALTVAGSDSGGGAGLQADLKTFAALGVFGTCAVTAVTAQNTTSVAASVPIDPGMVRLQVDTVLSDLPVAATKTGMLATSGIVRAVAEVAEEGRLPNLVVDPVLVSTTGHRLLDEDAIPLYVERLLPCADIVTPNLREARLLAGMSITSRQEMVDAARKIATFGPRTVVVKGGHLAGDRSPDVVLTGGADGELTVLDAERVETANDHGTGCTLSAATVAFLAKGEPTTVALERAKLFVTRAICGSARWSLGAGHGPLDHFGWDAPGGVQPPD
jgi:hydroxymethylpyrimidine/phosphomethylpyrimidine kinase